MRGVQTVGFSGPIDGLDGLQRRRGNAGGLGGNRQCCEDFRAGEREGDGNRHTHQKPCEEVCLEHRHHPFDLECGNNESTPQPFRRAESQERDRVPNTIIAGGTNCGVVTFLTVTADDLSFPLPPGHWSRIRAQSAKAGCVLFLYLPTHKSMEL